MFYHIPYPISYIIHHVSYIIYHIIYHIISSYPQYCWLVRINGFFVGDIVRYLIISHNNISYNNYNPISPTYFFCEPSTRRVSTVQRELREVQLQELGQEPRVQKVKQSLHQVPFRSIHWIDCEWLNHQFMLMVSVKNGFTFWTSNPIQSGHIDI